MIEGASKLNCYLWSKLIRNFTQHFSNITTLHRDGFRSSFTIVRVTVTETLSI